VATVLRQKQTIRYVQMTDGTVEEEREDVFVYVHCYNQACLRYHNPQVNLEHERKVPGIREEISYTYIDRGGDMPGVENTHVNWLVVDETDSRCPDCGDPLNISNTPSYKLMQYGVGPGTGLKGAERAAALAASKVNEANAAKDVEIADLRTQMARMERLMEKMIQGGLEH
jgi:hypothetical protein